MRRSVVRAAPLTLLLLLLAGACLAAAKTCTPQSHGAAADGVTDDTRAIQAAIDECAGKGTVLLSGALENEGALAAQRRLCHGGAKRKERNRREKGHCPRALSPLPFLSGIAKAAAETAALVSDAIRRRAAPPLVKGRKTPLRSIVTPLFFFRPLPSRRQLYQRLSLPPLEHGV